MQENLSLISLQPCAKLQSTDFNASLDDSLRDQLVSGLRSEAMHKRLLTEDKLTLSRAILVATGMETALKDAKSFQGNEQLGIHQFSTSQPCQACKHCGRKNHSAASCYFKSAKCHNCGKPGHIASVCRAPKKKPRKGGDFKQGGKAPILKLPVNVLVRRLNTLCRLTWMTTVQRRKSSVCLL